MLACRTPHAGAVRRGEMGLPGLLVSRILVHGFIGAAVVMGVVWICASDVMTVVQKCTGCDPADAGSSGCRCALCYRGPYESMPPRQWWRLAARAC